MRRTFWQDGEKKTGRLGNVYIHAKVSCVKRVQPQFIPFLVVIPPEVKRELEQVHQNYIQTIFSLSKQTKMAN